MTLCVIDMQDEFPACQGAVHGVLMEIFHANKRREPIIVVEYYGAGPTNHLVKNELKGSNRVFWCQKDVNDGSDEIVKVARQQKIKLDNIRVVGVNLGFCVSETVDGLCRIKGIGKIVIPLRATNCGDMQSGLSTIRHVQSLHKGKIRIMS